jgi:hypothetical protein
MRLQASIGNSLWLLASFGLLHGLSEWMDMFLTNPDFHALISSASCACAFNHLMAAFQS